MRANDQLAEVGLDNDSKDHRDQAADDTVESLHSKLMADLTLGGYAHDVVPVRTEFEFIEADKPSGLISCEYEIRYRTDVDDLTQ